jgi:hypothetical protein
MKQMKKEQNKISQKQKESVKVAKIVQQKIHANRE